jgi:hypothetical protein
MVVIKSVWLYAEVFVGVRHFPLSLIFAGTDLYRGRLLSMSSNIRVRLI